MGSDDKWTSDDVPRISIGEGTDKHGVARVKSVRGKLLYSFRQRIKKRMTTLHRFDGPEGEFIVYGSGAVNNKLAKLPPGTDVRMTYLGEKDTGQDTPMKDIRVEWPRGTKLLARPVEMATPARDPGDDDDFEDDPGYQEDAS